jgi:hypothetical protein
VVETVNRIFHCLPLLAAIVSLAARVSAHQLDEYLQATLVAIEPGEIRLEINLTPGVAVAEKVLDVIDRNHDGIISSEESATYAELLKRDLSVRLDGRNVELKLAALNFPEPAEMRTGWGIIQLEYSVKPGALAAGPHKLTLENRHLPAMSVYLINAARPSSTSVQVTGQTRNKNQSTGEIAFDFRPPRSPLVWLAAIVLFAGGILLYGVGGGGWVFGRVLSQLASRSSAN